MSQPIDFPETSVANVSGQPVGPFKGQEVPADRFPETSVANVSGQPVGPFKGQEVPADRISRNVGS